MAPRSFTNPAPKTESAKEARKSFFCELCQKGYSRMNEFEAHESSYDHQHKKRLIEMKRMQRDPNAADKVRRAERKAEEKSGLVKMKLENSGASKGGFKKGGFKSAFAPATTSGEESSSRSLPGFTKVSSSEKQTPAYAEIEELEDMPPDPSNPDADYDVRYPTECTESCKLCVGVEVPEVVEITVEDLERYFDPNVPISLAIPTE